MKRSLVIGLIAVVALSGCANAGEDASRTDTDSGWVTAQYVQLPDGRQVICVMSNTKISCDWENAK